MGVLAKALTNPSAYATKKNKPDLWGELVDKIDGAIIPTDLDGLEAWMELRPLDLPEGWYGELRDLIEKRREELADEDISTIIRDRYDFT
jgi:hypothetical protein